MSREQSKSYVIKLMYGNFKARKKVRSEGIEPEFQLVPMLGVGVLVDKMLKVFVPLVEIDKEDSDALFEKYGISHDSIVAVISEVTEETKNEMELRLE